MYRHLTAINTKHDGQECVRLGNGFRSKENKRQHEHHHKV